jgi:hypothetical protein
VGDEEHKILSENLKEKYDMEDIDIQGMKVTIFCALWNWLVIFQMPLLELPQILPQVEK